MLIISNMNIYLNKKNKFISLRIAIYIVFFLSFSCIPKESNRTHISNNFEIYHNKLNLYLDQEQSNDIINLISNFDIYLNNKFKRYPIDERMFQFIKFLTEKCVNNESDNNFIDLDSSFVQMVNNDIFKDIILEKGKKIKIDKNIADFYDSIMFSSKYKNHLTFLYDSIKVPLNTVSGSNESTIIDNSLFYNPYNNLYYIAFKTSDKKDKLFREMISNRIENDYGSCMLYKGLIKYQHLFNFNTNYFKFYIISNIIIEKKIIPIDSSIQNF